jgi:hypothetical protein
MMVGLAEMTKSWFGQKTSRTVDGRWANDQALVESNEIFSIANENCRWMMGRWPGIGRFGKVFQIK